MTIYFFPFIILLNYIIEVYQRGSLYRTIPPDLELVLNTGRGNNMSSKKNTCEWDGVPFDKHHKRVIFNSQSSHEDFINEMRLRMSKQGIGRPELARRIGGEQPQIYRMLNPSSNITLLTMSRAAAAVGAKVKLTFVDEDSE